MCNTISKKPFGINIPTFIPQFIKTKNHDKVVELERIMSEI